MDLLPKYFLTKSWLYMEVQLFNCHIMIWCIVLKILELIALFKEHIIKICSILTIIVPWFFKKDKINNVTWKWAILPLNSEENKGIFMLHHCDVNEFGSPHRNTRQHYKAKAHTEFFIVLQATHLSTDTY